jgi:hypothetical protein
MLESLITSKTRVKLLLKFFSNTNSTSYLRSLAAEFGESSNAVRVELNKLSEAGYLLSQENGRTIEFKANVKHPLFPELKSVVHKYLGLDKIVDKVIKKLGKVYLAFITGDYAIGKDTGIIDLVLVGEIDQDNLRRLVRKAEELIKRKLRTLVLSRSEYKKLKSTLNTDKALWLWGSAL